MFRETGYKVKSLFFYNKIKIADRCKMLRRDLEAGVWHPTKEGEIDDSQCTWGHFDAEAAFRYLIRTFSDVVEVEPEPPALSEIDQLSAGLWIEEKRRIIEGMIQ